MALEPGRVVGYPGAAAEIAQLVEQLIRNQQVVGSSPILGSIHRPGRKAGALLCQQVVAGGPARSSPILGSIQGPRFLLGLCYFADC
jgi:hypothetical protein